MELELIRGNRVLLFRQDYQITKRIFDIVVSLMVLPFFLLLMGLIALAIYIDNPGPIFFVQQRTGKGGRRFGMYKFRTMVKNAEELKAQAVVEIKLFSAADLPQAGDARQHFKPLGVPQ